MDTVLPQHVSRSLTLGPVLLHAGGVPQIVLTGLAGQTYSIQASADFFSWTTIASLTLTNIVGQFTDPGAGSFPRRFYRAADP